MTILTISKQALTQYTDEYLQGLEYTLRCWGRAELEEERQLLAADVLQQAHQLILLERFVKIKNTPTQEGLSPAENLQKVCKALLSEQVNAEPSSSARPLVYFYRLFYRMLSKDFSYSELLH